MLICKLKVLEDETLIGTDVWNDTKRILEDTVQREQESVETVGGKGKSDWQKLMNLLMQLRKVCNHPYQLQNAEPDPYISGEHLITASGKFIILEKLINELVVKQKKKICKYRRRVLASSIIYLSRNSDIFWFHKDVGSGRGTSPPSWW